MDIFVARQAIYDKKENVIGYELLYRSSELNKFDPTVGDEKATYEVIKHLYTIGFEELINNKKAFLNFPTEGILGEVATLLPKDNVVIEVLENVVPTLEVINSLKALKEQGYTIALDDLITLEGLIPYIGLVDIVKVDYMNITIENKVKIIKYIHSLDMQKKIKLLAEKIETEEELNEAKALGFQYFQGYYFSRPIVIQKKDFKVKNTTILKIMLEFLSEDVDINKLEELIKCDVVLSLKFLKFINSAYFNFVNKITSFKSAIMLIGVVEFKKWLAVMGAFEMDFGHGEEYANNTVVRAKFCELMCETINKSQKNSAFIVGLFSDLHLVMNNDFENVINELAVDMSIKNALLSEENIYKKILDLAISYERMDEESIDLRAKEIGINTAILSDLYIKSVEWVNDVKNYQK